MHYHSKLNKESFVFFQLNLSSLTACRKGNKKLSDGEIMTFSLLERYLNVNTVESEFLWFEHQKIMRPSLE